MPIMPHLEKLTKIYDGVFFLAIAIGAVSYLMNPNPNQGRNVKNMSKFLGRFFSKVEINSHA